MTFQWSEKTLIQGRSMAAMRRPWGSESCDLGPQGRVAIVLGMRAVGRISKAYDARTLGLSGRSQRSSACGRDSAQEAWEIRMNSDFFQNSFRL